MTIIVFLLDTSASMNQKVFFGGRPTLLDVAKSAVETFVKVRQRHIDSRGDRYMLLTFEEPPSNIKAGWKENLATFMSELKNLQANGLTTLGNALRHTFDVLNVNRMQHGIDTYGQGRCPFYLEPSIIVCITDGGQLSSNSGVQDELKMQGTSPGFELTREPFRWDQRLFSLVLRMSGIPSGESPTGLVPSDNSPIDAMCEVTGGRSYAITTNRMLHQCIDSLVQKVQAGVVIHFEKFGPDPQPIDGLKQDDSEIEMIDEKNGSSKPVWQNSRRMIYVPRTNSKGFAGGFWPIPESFWPDQTLPTLPARAAHPNLKFSCHPAEPLVVENFPFDKYELEPSPLTQFILARKQPTVCWQVYMTNSSRNNSIGFTFGYLKASTNLTCVNLFVMPYNYPVLLPLIDELFRLHRLKPSNEWRAQFAMYLAGMPPYYSGPLKRALIRMGATNIAQTIPEENYLSYSALSYLKKLKAQSKTEYDRTCNEVALRVKASEPKRVVASFKNPFDVPRHQLLDHLARLRSYFLRPSLNTPYQHDSLHNMPVGQMGNYQEYLKRMPTPLRELESAPVRQHMFGNPFKIDKRMIIDEADIDFMGSQGKSPKKDKESVNNNIPAGGMTPAPVQVSSPLPPVLRGMKRKAGPLPKDYRYTPYKNRKMHKGMDEDSDSDAYLSSAPSSPMSPMMHPASPTHNDLSREKENAIGDRLPVPFVESFCSSKDNRMFGDESLVVDESPYENKISSSMSFDGSNYSRNDTSGMNANVPSNEPPPYEDKNDLDDQLSHIHRYDMNGGSSIALQAEDVKPLIPGRKSPNAMTTTTTQNNLVIPPDNGKILPTVVQKPNHVKANASINSIPPSSPSTNHVGPVSSPNSKSKKKSPSSTKNAIQASTSVSTKITNKEELKPPPAPPPPPPPPVDKDDEKTASKNLAIRIELFSEIRRPRMRTDYILSQLTMLSGSLDTKLRFIKELAREALRFKRKTLANAINDQAKVLAPLCRKTS